ncbi:unnamed protein product, partial [Closterium sp. Naga37s-1]
EFWRPPSTPKPVMESQLKQAKKCLPMYSPPVPPIGLEKLMEGGTGAGGTGGFAGFGSGGGWGLGAGWWGAVERAGGERKEGTGEAGWLSFEGLVDVARGMMWGGGGDGGGEGAKEEKENILGTALGKSMGDQDEEGEAVEGEEEGLAAGEEGKCFEKGGEEGDSGGIAGEGGAKGGG